MIPRHPLAGLRVVEIGSRVSAAYCGKLLRDAGAQVIKVEPGGGDPLRRYRPVGAGPAASAASSFFSYLAAGKRSVTVANTAGLCAWADIIVAAANPAQAREIGVDPAKYLEAQPSCVVVTISDFGWSGPWTEYPATEFTLQAWCGSTGSRGVPERPPIAAGGDLGEFIAGGYAAFFALATHFGGGGAHVDLSVLEAMTSSMQTFGWLRKSVAGLQRFSRSTEVPSVEPAKDGYVGVSMGTDAQWLNFCRMIDRPDLAEIHELRFQLGRWKHRDMVRTAIGPWFAQQTVDEIVQLAETYRVPMVPIGNGATLPQMSHFVERNVFVRNPAGFRQPRPPWQMSEAQPCPPAPAPALGEANGGIETLWPARSSEAPASATSAPLRGLRVLDLTAFWAGPAATQMLAMLGADVVKVESIQRPDGMRYSGGLRGDVEEWWEYSWVFQAVNTNKKAVTLDLRSARGKELFGRLVAEADLVTENFPARVMEDLGLDYDALKRLNDRVIFLRMPAFGLDGPWRNRGGFAMTMEQIGGLAWITGYDDDVPTAPRGPCDALAAVHAAFAVMCAVQFRDRTGRGQQVEVPMIETVLNAAALQVIEHDVSGIVLTRRGNHSDRFPVQNVYACAGEEQWIAASVRDEGDWTALKDALGQPDWPLDNNSDQRLADWLQDQPLHDAVSKLLAAGIPAAPVVLPTEIANNEQLKARVFFETGEHPLCGAIQCARPPITPLGDRTHFVDSPAPTLGQHNHEILCQRIGLTAEDVSALEAEGVIGTRPAVR